MNYTIETHPDIGSTSGNNVGNGTYSLTISGIMNYNTEYTWYVNVTDGNYWTKKEFNFITASSEPVLNNEIPTVLVVIIESFIVRFPFDIFTVIPVSVLLFIVRLVNISSELFLK